MDNIAQAPICLKLNTNWNAVGISTVQSAFVDLVQGVVEALDIDYEVNNDGSPNPDKLLYTLPVTWEVWKNLPIRSWDLSINTSKSKFRVPTVVITKNYSKMPMKRFRGKPSKEALFFRDNGLDAYTGKPIKFGEATIDHVIPLDRGGTDTYCNTALTTKSINNKKGNKLNEEVGLKLLITPTIPKEIPIWKTFRKIRHPDWSHFLK